MTMTKCNLTYVCITMKMYNKFFEFKKWHLEKSNKNIYFKVICTLNYT